MLTAATPKARTAEHPIAPFIRMDRMPHIWCPNCGIGIVVKCFASALEQSKLDLDKVAVVSGIGCTRRVAGYVRLDGFHTTHGRAIPFAIGLEHKQLRESLLDLERMLEGPPPVRDLSAWVASFAERLRRATEDVARHFAWEMNTGLFSQIESALPQASAQCRALLAEHAEIDARLTELSSRLTMPSDRAGLHLLMHDVRTVLDRLHRHEEHENQLLLDAVEIEIAAQD